MNPVHRQYKLSLPLATPQYSFEQTWCPVLGNSHSSRQAAVELMNARMTLDTTYATNTVYQLNWATYKVNEKSRNWHTLYIEIVFSERKLLNEDLRIRVNRPSPTFIIALLQSLQVILTLFISMPLRESDAKKVMKLSEKSASFFLHTFRRKSKIII